MKSQSVAENTFKEPCGEQEECDAYRRYGRTLAQNRSFSAQKKTPNPFKPVQGNTQAKALLVAHYWNDAPNTQTTRSRPGYLKLKPPSEKRDSSETRVSGLVLGAKL